MSTFAPQHNSFLLYAVATRDHDCHKLGRCTVRDYALSLTNDTRYSIDCTPECSRRGQLLGPKMQVVSEILEGYGIPVLTIDLVDRRRWRSGT